MKINPEIFRSYDIRAVYGEDLTDEVAELLGKGYGTYMKQNNVNEVIVGRDSRFSSLALRDALVKGLVSTGVNVLDIGLVTTPIYYYSREIYGIKPGIMITASHNPPEYNGFKMSTCGDERMFDEKIQDMRKLIEKGEFAEGEGSVREVSPVQDYIKELSEKCKIGKRKIKVVVDCGNGTASIAAVKVLEGIGCEVIPLYCEIDPSQPNHIADPAVIENMQDLILKVKETNADLGIGLDGDSDRIGVVDEQGNIIFGDQYQIIMLREILPKHPGASIPVEVKCSYALYEEIEKLGGKPFYQKTGNPWIYDCVQHKGSPFAGEMSGHVFFADEYYGYDDGLYAACRICRLLSNTDKKCSELLEGITKYYITPEMKFATPDNVKFEKIEKAKQYFVDKGEEIVDVDGVRVLFKDGWGLLRASNTGPNIIMRCEARTPEGLEQIKTEMETALKNA